MSISRREIAGFLSYVREDDLADAERITELRRRLEAEIRMQTGDAFSIFQDRDDIFTGERWRSRIENSIDDTSLLIAVITPSFLKRENCRTEVRLFIDREQRLGRDDLIIPILYINTPALKDADDEIAVNLASRQYFNWTELRFEDFESNRVRRELADLALQVIDTIDRSRQSNIDQIAPDQPSDDGPGFLELQAEAEEALQDLILTINSLSETTERIAGETQNAAAAITSASSSGRPASVRLAIVQRLSRRLEEPSTEMDNLANAYLNQVTRVGGGIYLFVEQVAEMDEADLEAAGGLLRSLGTMRDATVQALDSLEEYQASLVRAFSISSSLRPVLRRIHDALEKVMSSRPTFIAWYEDLADALAQRN